MKCAILLALVAIAAAHLTTNNPTICDPNVKQYSGYFNIDPTTSKKYFYWAFSSRSDPANDPVVLWMTGGPGCSSLMALFAENGPCSVNPSGTGTINNTFSWSSRANMVYIDQPAGVGFSTSSKTGYDTNEVQVANDMYAFLQDFFAAHPEWQKNEFYVFGESYGGHYAPAVSHRVWQGNQNGTGLKINLRGVGIGNGLTDPQVQYSYYAEMAYNYSITKVGHPIVSISDYQSMTAAIPQCIKYISQCNKGSGSACQIAQEYCNNAEMGPYEETGMNPYDIRIKCAVPPLCYDFSNVATYLNSASVQQQLGVSGTWQSCNMKVNSMFAKDWMQNYQVQLPDLLASNIKVLIYAGDCDFICNWLGNKAWTLAMSWPGQSAFNAAADNAYVINGTQVGEIRTAQGFSFVRVYNAGHMVPMNQPGPSLGILNNFIHS
jgi:cathepsin A (carboxypeptidase C)